MPNFRFAAKNAFLTYSDVCECLTKESVYFTIDERYPVKRYSIGEEIHPSTGGRHFHAVFEFIRKVSSIDLTCFDIPCEHTQVHPNIQPVKKGAANFQRCVDYTTKDDPNPLTNIELKKTWGEVMDEATSADDYLRLVKLHYPREYALNLQRLEYTAQKAFPTYGVNTIESYSADFVITLPQELIMYVPPPMKSVVVVGPAGCGKTTWAKIIAPKPCLFVRHLDSLSELNSRHKSIIFDDLEFGHLPVSTQKFLCDMENLSEIHIRYKVARIPSGILRIFTANSDPFSAVHEHRLAINRRCSFINLFQ